MTSLRLEISVRRLAESTVYGQQIRFWLTPFLIAFQKRSRFGLADLDGPFWIRCGLTAPRLFCGRLMGRKDHSLRAYGERSSARSKGLRPISSSIPGYPGLPIWLFSARREIRGSEQYGCHDPSVILWA